MNEHDLPHLRRRRQLENRVRFLYGELRLDRADVARVLGLQPLELRRLLKDADIRKRESIVPGYALRGRDYDALGQALGIELVNPRWHEYDTDDDRRTARKALKAHGRPEDLDWHAFDDVLLKRILDYLNSMRARERRRAAAS